MLQAHAAHQLVVVSNQMVAEQDGAADARDRRMLSEPGSQWAALAVRSPAHTVSKLATAAVSSPTQVGDVVECAALEKVMVPPRCMPLACTKRLPA